MKRLFLLVVIALSLNGFGQDKMIIPAAPPQNRRPQHFKPDSQIHSPEELRDESSEFMQRAARVYQHIQAVNNMGKWKPTAESIDRHEAPEWYKDAKFGMFIDWGLWSVPGWAPRREKGAMYPDWYEYRMEEDSTFRRYHHQNWGADFKRDDFIPLFTASSYQPELLVKIAREAGMKYLIPFCKHHSGFCLWPSSLTLRDASDMGPHKDLIKPLVESCRKSGLKFGFYFSIEEWEYPIIDDDGKLVARIWGKESQPWSVDLDKKTSGKIPVRNFATDYLLPQGAEFIDRYDPDILWYDGDWSSNVSELKSYDLAAYFYNQAEGNKEVAVNDRYGKEAGKWLRARRGDIFTDEYGDQEKEAKQIHHVWEENRGISQSFGYNWQDMESNVISSKNFIDMFVDIVANGGNLMLIVNLDGKGALPAVQENRLKEIGNWLKINGEGIYATRPWKTQFEGSMAYTRSKDNKMVFVILKEWPGKEVILKQAAVQPGSEIRMLGYKNPLKWTASENSLRIEIPESLQKPGNRPCSYAWVLKIKQP